MITFITYYLSLGLLISTLMPIFKLIMQADFKGELTSKELALRMLGWVLLWPILIFYTLPILGLSTLFEKHDSFDFSGAIDRRHDELLALWESPPDCSNVVEVSGHDESSYEPLGSRLIFNANDVEAYLRELAPKNEFNVLNQDAIILKWINQRNTDDNSSCTVPEELDRFKSTANSLLFKGQGKVFCESCQTEYTANQLDCISDKLSAGWNFNRIKCSNGHLISVAKGIHLNCRPN